MTKSRSMSPPPPYATVQDYNQNSTATGTNTMPSSAIIPLPLSEEDSFDCLFDNYFSLNDNLCLPNGDDVKHETLSLSPVSLPKQPENYNLPPLSSVSLPNRQYNYNYLPSGYKFRPKDEELILYYLMKKLSNQSLPCNIVIDVDLYKFNPWDLLAEKQSTGEKQEIVNIQMATSQVEEQEMDSGKPHKQIRRSNILIVNRITTNFMEKLVIVM
ncbi:hypothetical protein ACOSQ3_032052 [Xanthoceras sorbifolium]